jgi:SAM-dependent methyltransferase
VTWQDSYFQRFYFSRPDFCDGTREFWGLCGEWIRKGSRILEIGPGPCNPTTQFLSGLGELHGADVDAAAVRNAALVSAAVLGPTGHLPFEDGSFDACVSNYVLEHVAEPAAHFAEVARVLRPGGRYVFRTPNAYHYVSVAARFSPHWVHDLVANRLRGLPAGAHDPYPTFYRANTARVVERLAAGAGLDVAVLRMTEKEPFYGKASRALFLAFMGYERLVNRFDALAPFRANILAVLTKSATATSV